MVVPENQARVIVTGSSGFIGEAVCRAFVEDGYAVVGFERPHALQPQHGVTHIPCDVTDEDSVAQAVSSVLRDFAEPLASIIHLASDSASTRRARRL
jgi:nucleoside-diphosphate-sugar epimerase